MKQLNGQVLNDILEDIQKFNFIEFLNKYVEYINSEDLQHYIEVYKQTRSEYLLKGAIKEFNILLFLAIPNNFQENFAYWVQEDKIDSLSYFLSLNKEYQDLEGKQNTEKGVSFKKCSREIQYKFLKEARQDEYNKYFYLANNNVQNEVLRSSSNPLYLQLFPDVLDEESENYIREYITLEYQQLQDFVEGDILDVYEAFRRLYNAINNVPSHIYMEYIENFLDQNIELFNNTNIQWSQIEKNYNGECLLELLSRLDIEQQEGKFFYLNFESTYIDVDKLIDISKKYKISCDLTLTSCADLPIDSLNILRQQLGIDIKTVKFKDTGLNSEQEEPYNIEDYVACRKIIDTIIENIELDSGVLGKNDPNREKKICSLAVRKLANLMTYNHEFVEREHNELASKEETIINRNLIGSLLQGEGVCAGYAEALRNILLCCEIECRYISGKNNDPNKPGHAWNQVKLDGYWYNLDLTWDADRIIEELDTKYYLKSDEDFIGHNKYLPRTNVKRCMKTEHDTYRYLYRGRINKTITTIDLMRKAIINRKQDRITLSDVNSYDTMRNIAIKEKKEFEKD